MKNWGLLLLAVLLVFDVSPSFGETSRDAMEASNHQFAEWTKDLAEFVKDVRFTEEDLQSFINLYDDFNEIGADDSAEDEEYTDFNKILNDAGYLAWAGAKGLDGEKWLKKTMRIFAVMMRLEIEENSSEEQVDLESQLAELEEMRSRIGDESYQQMKQALAAGAAAMADMEESSNNLPVPSDTEKALIARYKDRLIDLE